jgi:hypothetical protein
VKRIALATAAFSAAIVVAGSAYAAGTPTIASHVYSARITGATPPVLNGVWRLTVRPTVFSVAKGSALAVAGSARIAGKRITFHDLRGPFACRGAQATAVYTWRVSGARLSLTAVREPCAGRKTILTKRFTRVL